MCVKAFPRCSDCCSSYSGRHKANIMRQTHKSVMLSLKDTAAAAAAAAAAVKCSCETPTRDQNGPSHIHTCTLSLSHTHTHTHTQRGPPIFVGALRFCFLATAKGTQQESNKKTTTGHTVNEAALPALRVVILARLQTAYNAHTRRQRTARNRFGVNSAHPKLTHSLTHTLTRAASQPASLPW